MRRVNLPAGYEIASKSGNYPRAILFDEVKWNLRVTRAALYYIVSWPRRQVITHSDRKQAINYYVTRRRPLLSSLSLFLLKGVNKEIQFIKKSLIVFFTNSDNERRYSYLISLQQLTLLTFSTLFTTFFDQ